METRAAPIFLFRVTVDIKSAGRINIYYDCPAASTINMNLITAAVYIQYNPPKKYGWINSGYL